MLTHQPMPSSNRLRDTITNAYRMDETDCLNALLPDVTLPKDQLNQITTEASRLVAGTRQHKKKLGKLDTLLHQYDLSTEEGIALMCLAEALLRIPDSTTMDKFISDKLSSANWKNHLDKNNPLFVNAATWSLLLTGKLYQPQDIAPQNLWGSLKRLTSRLSTTMLRPIILKMMKAIGNQFVCGESIEAALKHAKDLEKCGYLFSYDMLGEAARTSADAEHYFNAYQHAIHAIGLMVKTTDPRLNPGISVKLSALHPRYDYTQRERVLQEIPPLLLTLAQQAKQYHLGLTVDAEEADRLDLSLDIIERVFKDPSLDGWEGFGLAVQAYQKRASYVIDWLAALSKETNKRFMVRLVKGAYWDAEIKSTQLQGLTDYPVFTRKNATDVSYLACAKKLLAQPDCFYTQFGTHNAYSVAAILAMAPSHANYEFQCLYGMGRPLYDQLVANRNAPACRMYAPVGTHKDLLGYLVRRLLENGANSSFVNRLANEDIPIEKIIADPVARIASLAHKPHPRIPKPKDIYHDWINSSGVDLSDLTTVYRLKAQIEATLQLPLKAASIVNGQIVFDATTATKTFSPSNPEKHLGNVSSANEAALEQALDTAKKAFSAWENTPIETRAATLERAATLLQQAMPRLIALLILEGGKCIPDCISEIREAIDYCHYYAYRARQDLTPAVLPGPTGEANTLSLHPRGVIACISPWNFPLAIFSGQLLAALVAGNCVIAKPAEQTPLIAYQVVQLLHEAGIPQGVLQLLLGTGETVGAQLVGDSRIDGVMFTGSTETAKSIERTLANRSGPLVPFVAETGGQNAMIVDSSALPEQTVHDIAQSAFNSAGQRCSALRVLFVQEDIAPKLLDMLSGYMAELRLGEPSQLSTDIGPLIDSDALQTLERHFARMSREAALIARVPSNNDLKGHYFAPSVFELTDIGLLHGEVFGPILHVIRYKANELEKVLEAIISTGYGLTLGIHSRIDSTIQTIIQRMPVGNTYVNRNMIGAVVGVQPFGGERLSGTGPKAGGPYYLPRLCVERAVSINTTAVGGNARLVSLLEDD